ncbi:MAG: hypothetical protein HZA50_06430 [Planctomycetes bacterium]|nr:hypothetical protein [Planctomycetota bacterium]
MPLKYKPDFEQVKDVWDHFWNHELKGRPPVIASVPRPGCKQILAGENKYKMSVAGEYQKQLEQIDAWLESTLFLAESIPHFGPDHGPDQFAAFLGGNLVSLPDSPDTNWIDLHVEDWSKALPLKIDPKNRIWNGLQRFVGLLKEHAKDRYLIGVCDLHSNMDTLLALRGAENLSMDFYDCPELIERAMADVRKLYVPVYETLYKAAGMNSRTGTIGWIPFWCEGKFATIQCDYICMVSPEMSRKYIIPALEEEAEYLDRCCLHFDGPGALPHLNDVLSIKAIDSIQWVSGAGQKEMHLWTDVLTACQKAGKSVIVDGNPEQIKSVHKSLKPELTAYQVGVKTQQELDDLLKWLEKNS